MKARLLPLMLLLGLFSYQSIAQCGLTVDAGQDQAVCFPGQSVTLNGSFTGDACGFIWDPIIGLSDPNSLNPSVTVLGNQTYTLSAVAFDPAAPNLVVNGNFEAGNTSFTSNYTYALPDGSLDEEEYTLVTVGSQARPEWGNCGDHTSGSGNMMAVNAATLGGVNVWCQTVPVAPNTNYIFSTWLVTLFPVSPAQLQFWINGMPFTPLSYDQGSLMIG